MPKRSRPEAPHPRDNKRVHFDELGHLIGLLEEQSEVLSTIIDNLQENEETSANAASATKDPKKDKEEREILSHALEAQKRISRYLEENNYNIESLEDIILGLPHAICSHNIAEYLINRILKENIHYRIPEEERKAIGESLIRMFPSFFEAESRQQRLTQTELASMTIDLFIEENIAADVDEDVGYFGDNEWDSIPTQHGDEHDSGSEEEDVMSSFPQNQQEVFGIINSLEPLDINAAGGGEAETPSPLFSPFPWRQARFFLLNNSPNPTPGNTPPLERQDALGEEDGPEPQEVAMLVPERQDTGHSTEVAESQHGRLSVLSGMSLLFTPPDSPPQ